MGMTNEKQASSIAAKKLTIKDYISYIGPGTIMAAAVVGPETVTTCSKQGATYGYQALWIMAIACIIAYFYQEPAIRVVLGTKKSVMTGIRENIGTKYAKGAYGIICYGSAAHQAANLVGAAMALNFFIPSVGVVVWAAVIAAIAFVIVLVNKYALVERVNTVLILLMVGAFVVTMFVSGPSITDIFTEGFTFKVPGGDVLLVLALMSTTIMPNAPLSFSGYLLERFPDAEGSQNEVKLNRFDLGLNMFLTFLISASIIICAATVVHPLGIEIETAADMANALVPLLGRFAGVFFAFGLAAAAISSAIYRINIQPILFSAAVGKKEVNPKDKGCIAGALIVAVAPVILIGLWGGSPVSLIIVAQVLYGVFLPVLVLLVWKLCSNKDFMGKYVNSKAQNMIQLGIFLFTLFFSINAIYQNVILKIMAMMG